MTTAITYTTTGNFDVIVSEGKSKAKVITPSGDDYTLNLDQLRDLGEAVRQAEGLLTDLAEAPV
jgi:hypothetical protein